MASLAIGKFTEYKAIELDSLALKAFVGVYENENGDQRIVTMSDGQLYSMRSGGSKQKIFPYEKNKFFFGEGMSTCEFLTDDKGQVTAAKIIRTGVMPSTWTRTAKPIPVKTEVSLDPKSFEKYVGEYELVPGFTLKVFLDGNRLMTQATGQEAVEVFAEAPGKFFLKVVDARIEFVDGADGRVEKLILYQNGTHTAKKIR
jgi:hypothetical protein